MPPTPQFQSIPIAPQRNPTSSVSPSPRLPRPLPATEPLPVALGPPPHAGHAEDCTWRLRLAPSPGTESSRLVLRVARVGTLSVLWLGGAPWRGEATCAIGSPADGHGGHSRSACFPPGGTAWQRAGGQRAGPPSLSSQGSGGQRGQRGQGGQRAKADPAPTWGQPSSALGSSPPPARGAGGRCQAVSRSLCLGTAGDPLGRAGGRLSSAHRCPRTRTVSQDWPVDTLPGRALGTLDPDPGSHAHFLTGLGEARGALRPQQVLRGAVV